MEVRTQRSKAFTAVYTVHNNYVQFKDFFWGQGGQKIIRLLINWLKWRLVDVMELWLINWLIVRFIGWLIVFLVDRRRIRLDDRQRIRLVNRRRIILVDRRRIRLDDRQRIRLVDRRRIRLVDRRIKGLMNDWLIDNCLFLWYKSMLWG